MQLHFRRTGDSNFAFHLRRVKNYFWISCSFQNLFVHALVARIVSAFTTGDEHHDVATSLSGCPIKMNGPTLEIEGAVNGVQAAVYVPVHFGLRWIERRNNFRSGGGSRLQARRGCGRGKKNRQAADEQN